MNRTWKDEVNHFSSVKMGEKLKGYRGFMNTLESGQPQDFKPRNLSHVKSVN